MNRQDNVIKIDSQKSSFEFTYLSRDVTLHFDDEYLYEEWESGFNSGKKAYQLRNLSPMVGEETKQDKEALKWVRLSLVLIVLAVIFYFSSFNADIPLLSPGLVLIGIAMLAVNVRKTWPRNWVEIYDEFGRIEILVLNKDSESYKSNEKLEKFITSLVKQIEKAKYR